MVAWPHDGPSSPALRQQLGCAVPLAGLVITPLCHLLRYLGEEKLCTHTHTYTFMKTYMCMKLGDLSTALRALCALLRPPCSFGISKQEISFSNIAS